MDVVFAAHSIENVQSVWWVSTPVDVCSRLIAADCLAGSSPFEQKHAAFIAVLLPFFIDVVIDADMAELVKYGHNRRIPLS